jgi:hypothetical protein
MNRTNGEDETLTRLEGELRAALGPAAATSVPISLRLRIAAIPEARPERRRSGWKALGAGLASVGSIAAILVLALTLASSLPGPAAEVGNASPAGPEGLEGTGILDRVAPLLPWIPPATGLGLAVALLAFARRRGRSVPVALLAALGLAGLGIALAAHPPLGISGWGPQEGLVVEARPDTASPGPAVLAIVARPGERFGLRLLLRNPGPLPMRILGVVQPASEGAVLPRWTGAGVLVGAPPGSMLGWEEASPFEPFELPPEGLREIFLVGRASSCATGPLFGAEEWATATRFIAPQIRIAYSVLGLSTEVAIDDVVISQPIRTPCP